MSATNARDASPIDTEFVTQVRFSWTATLAASIIGVCVTLVLLFLGSGFGLALLPGPGDVASSHTAFFTMGAIYFLAAQAFGMATGGHIVGRLIGPEIETSNEETFRAGAHGLAVWASSILITLILVAATGALAGKFAIGVASLYGARETVVSPPDTTAFLVDTLFRPQAASGPQPMPGPHASLNWSQFAQANTQEGTDAAPAQASPANPQQDTTESKSSPETPPDSQEQGGSDSSSPSVNTPSQSEDYYANTRVRHTPGDLAPAPVPASAPDPQKLAADKAEVAHMLDVMPSDGTPLPVEDRDRIAQLVAQDTNISYEAATARANDVQARVRAARKDATGRVRATASFLALWLAASLIFGAAVAVIAAVSARWEDDMQTMFAFVRPRGAK